MKILFRIIRYIRPYWSLAAVIYTCLIGVTLLTLIGPWLIGNAVDAALGEEDDFILFPADWTRQQTLTGTAILIVILAIIRGLINFGQRYGIQWLGRKIAYDIRMDLFVHLQRLPFAFYDHVRIGQLMSRVVGDVDEIRFFAGVVIGDAINLIVLLVGIYAIMFSINPSLTLIFLIPMPFLFVVAYMFGTRLEPYFGEIRSKRGEMYARIQENLSQIVVVKAFVREPFAREKFQDDNTKVLAAWIRLAWMFTLALPVIWYIVGFLTFLLLFFGGNRVIDGKLSLGTLVAFNSYVALLGLPTHRLAFMIDVTARAIANGKRIFSIMDTTPEIKTRMGAINPGPIEGHITFDNVSFVYSAHEDEPEVDVLYNISFEAAPGTVTAIVGMTGSGKTTLIDLIPRFYDVSEGSICIDGLDVRDLPLKLLRSQVGFVMQNTFLFNATVQENIAFGRPEATHEEIVTAAHAARAHDFILEFPDGYNTLVGERGVTLSGGQRQRIAIARALIVNPRILILDDATASVDSHTEYEIRAALQNLMEGRTTLIVAQRLSTVMHADQIIMLENGRIVERGTHDELVRLGGRYANLWRLQTDQEAPPEDIRGIGLSDEEVIPPAARPPQVEDRRQEKRITAEFVSTSEDSRKDDEIMSENRPKLERPMSETLSRLLGFTRPYRRRVTGIVILMLVTSMTVLISPAAVRQVINEGLAKKDTSALALYSLLFLAVITVEAVCLRIQMYNMIWIGQHVIMDVRRRLFYKYLELDLAYFDHNRVGDLMARVTEDSNALQNFITWAVVNTISNTFTLIGILIVMLVYDWSLALLTFTILPPMIGLTWWWRKQSSARYRAVREAVGVVSATLQESLAGMRIVQAFVREYREKARFGDVTTTELNASLRADLVASIFLPGIDLLSQIGVAIVLSVGGIRVINGDLTPGTLVAFLLYLNLFFDPIRDLAMRLDQFLEAAAAGERILAILDTEAEIIDAPGAGSLPALAGSVELRGVSFYYTKPEPKPAGDNKRNGKTPASSDENTEEANILNGIDLVAQPGQTIALVGHTGAGKSTLVRLLGRFYEPQSGQILFDGFDSSSVTRDSLRAQIAWVPQDTGLFATTIAENLRYGRLDATDEDIEAAARETGAHEFISQMPKGYATDVEEGGSRLSAGQRQLISFTRALLADPRIIILDEATSSVDTITEIQMQAALGKLLQGRTAFVIAHRLSTIIRADQVIVMDHGRIIERGTHQELLAAQGPYYHLYTTQLQGNIDN